MLCQVLPGNSFTHRRNPSQCISHIFYSRRYFRSVYPPVPTTAAPLRFRRSGSNDRRRCLLHGAALPPPTPAPPRNLTLRHPPPRDPRHLHPHTDAGPDLVPTIPGSPSRTSNSETTRPSRYTLASAPAALAQSAERLTRNEKVVGSIPTGGSTSDQRKRCSDTLFPNPSWCGTWCEGPSAAHHGQGEGQVQRSGVRRVILRRCCWSGCEGLQGGFDGLLGGGVVDGLGAGEDVESEVAAAFGPFVVLFGQDRAD